MSTKVELITGAYSRMRISGLTKQPSGDDVTTALRRLENMAAEWEKANVCTGYAFEDEPDAGTPHNVPREYWSAYESNLAVRLLADFGKDPMPSLLKEARGAFSRISAATATVAQTLYPNRQPVGSGNTLRHNRFQQFYQNVETAPNECETVRMLEGEVDIRDESFEDNLRSTESISTYTIESSDQTKLAISAASLTTPVVTYTVTAVEAGVYKVTIKATSVLGRVFIRKINFVVSEE